MNGWEIAGVLFALGLFIKLGNKRQLAGRTRPENGKVFGALLLIAFGVVMFMWLKSTGQHL